MFREAGSLARALVAGLLSALIFLCPQTPSLGASLKTSALGEQGSLSESPSSPSAQRGATTTPKASSRLSVDETYRLSAGDVVQVVVFGEPTLSGVYRIGPGGSIAVPILGQTTLRGLTLKEAEAFVTGKLKTLLKRPSVTVTIDEISSYRKVYISGECQHNGALTLPFGSTLTDAVTAANPGPYADLRHVRLTHPGGKPIEVDCGGLRGDGSLGVDHRLEYGDSVFVPRVREGVTVLGEVNNPGTILLPVGEQFKVLDALKMAAGFTLTADRSRAVLLRDGVPATDIDLDKLLHDGSVAENRALQGGDVLVVHRAESISVVGQVQKPQVLNAAGKVPILQALAAAMGPSPAGDLTKAEIIRNGRNISVDLQKFLDDGQAPAEFALLPGDVLVIPRGEGQNVLVSGAVAYPGVVNLRGVAQRDLMRIVTMVRPTQMSDMRRVAVYRDGATMVRDLKALMDNGDLSQNVILEPGDMVVVPQAEQTVVVTGAVQRAGVVRLVSDEWRNLAQLVLMSGPLGSADLTNVTVSRGGEKLVFNVRNYVDAGDSTQTMELQDGDMVRVPSVEQSVLLSGALSRGGVIRLYEGLDRDLLTLVLAGQPVAIADLEHVTVHRGDQKIVKNLRALLDGEDRSQSMLIEAGDIITVPSREVHNILVTGAVGRPGLMQVVDDERRDLARMLALAGPLPNADLSKIKVHRADMTTVRDIQTYLDTGLAQNTLLLEDGDVVVVPRVELTVVVMGAVGYPGSMNLVDKQQRDLLRVVTMARPAPTADLTQVAVVRGDERIVKNLLKLAEDGDMSQTLALQDGDVISVPMYDQTILVAGAAQRTGVLGLGPVEQRDLARTVVSSAPNAYADLRNVRVHRGGNTTTHDIYAYLHEGDQSQNLQLEEGDVVLIPLDNETALVTGAVGRAGAYRVSDPEQRDLAEILTNVGLLPTADLRRVTVFRAGEQTAHDLSGMYEEGGPVQTMEILPGDRILVPGMDATTVLISGAVGRPGTMEISQRDQRDLAKVVVGAAPLMTADLSRVTLHRGDQAMVKDIRAFLETGNQEHNITLEDGDTILVPETGSRSIMITGQVGRPGTIPNALGQTPDLFGAVMMAAPNRPTADLSRVAVYRNGEKLVRDLVKLEEDGDMSQNLMLEEGDMVFVPEATETVVFMGEVAYPGAMNIHGYRERDLGHLLSAARPNPEAGISKVKVYRGGEVLEYNYRSLLENGDMTQNVELEPGDFIYVPKDDGNEIMVLGALKRLGTVNVREPSNRDLLRIVTVMGPLPTADLTRVTVYRGDEEPMYRDLKLLQDEGDLAQTMDVQPGDVVVVPQLDEVYVLGAFGHPGAYPLDPGWSLMDLLARAGISDRGQDTLVVMRKRPDGTTEQVKINLRLLRAGTPPENLKLRSGDILYVPPKIVKRGKSLWDRVRDLLWIAGAVINLNN